MRALIVCLLAGGLLSVIHSLDAAPPGGGRGGKSGNGSAEGGKGGPRLPVGRGNNGGNSGGNGNTGGNGQSMIQQLMSLDANSDGALTPDEVTDPRLQAMLTQADTNADGAVTLAELTAMNSSGPQGGPPRPCEVMPGLIQDQLQLTDTQRQQIVALQAQVDIQLAQILTTQQMQQLAAGPPGGGPGRGGRMPRN
jgi:hypothetical protein